MFCFSSFEDKIACISSSGRTLTYADLIGFSKLAGAVMEPHQLVFCLCGKDVGAIAGYVSFLNNDDASLLLNAKMSKESYDELFAVYRPGYIWAPETSALVGNAQKVLNFEGYALFKTGENTRVSDNLAVLLATSGSTGSPKMVRLSKNNLRSNAAAIVDYLHISSDERPILGLPMHYAFGLSIVNSHLSAGATLLLTEYPFAGWEFHQFALANSCTSYSGVPYAFETIKRLQIWRRKMPTLRTVTLAGGMLDEETQSFFSKLFAKHNIAFYIMYGQAEATARIAYLDPTHLEDKAGSIGKEIPGGKLSLIDDSGQTIDESGIVGELVYEGPNVSLGYASYRDDLLKGDENNGVLRTGDLAYRDSDGFYYISGRKSRFIKLFGLRICLDHLESLLAPFLRDYACEGDSNGVYIYTADTDFDKDKIIDFLASRTGVIKKAFSVYQIKEMPRSEAGKVQYNELKGNEI